MKEKLIESRSNPHFKALRKLKPGFDSPFIMVEGAKLVGEALKSGLIPQAIWSHSPIAFDTDCHRFRMPTDFYKQVSPTRSANAPLAIFSRPALADGSTQNFSTGRYLLLDQIQDPGNAGALVRAAAAFAFDGIIWHSPCAFPYHHACIRASAGTVFHMNHVTLERVEWLANAHLIGTAADGTTQLDDYRWPADLILAMGNEGHGLSQGVAAKLAKIISIPISKNVESLNVAGAAHIIMYHLRRLN